MMRRFISILLVLVLILNTVPLQALAGVPSYENTRTVLSAARKAVSDATVTAEEYSSGMSAGDVQKWLTAYMDGSVTSTVDLINTLADCAPYLNDTAAADALSTVTSQEQAQALLRMYAEAEYARFTLEDERYVIEQKMKVVEDGSADEV